MRDSQKTKLEFSKKLAIWASVFIGLFCVISVLLWILTGDWPREIAELFVRPLIAGIVGCMAIECVEKCCKYKYGSG